jgi:hypothetical protein
MTTRQSTASPTTATSPHRHEEDPARADGRSRVGSAVAVILGPSSAREYVVWATRAS